jgi:hypothetical protein
MIVEGMRRDWGVREGNAAMECPRWNCQSDIPLGIAWMIVKAMRRDWGV